MTKQNETFQERQKKNKAPLRFEIFKGVGGKFGALRLNLKKAYTEDKRNRDNGCIFLEMAPATGKNIYDWQNSKAVIALNLTDLSKILLYLRSPQHSMFKKNEGNLKLYHDKGAGTAKEGQEITSLTISKPEGRSNFFWSIYQKRQDTTKTVSVPVSPDETLTIGTLLQAALPTILMWNSWTRDDDLHKKVDFLNSRLDKLLSKES